MDIFVARQPILDRRQAVYGYELLFRSGFENVFSHTDGDQASSRVIRDSLLSFGFDRLTGDRKAFINFTRNVLVQELYALLPQDRAVVELLESVEPDDEVVEACRTLKQAGYLLALDDFVFKPEFEPLLDLADIVKVDVLSTSPGDRRGYADRFRSRKIKLLAEKVETREQFDEAMSSGYSYFQGYFFCKPQVVSRKELSGLQVNYLRFLKEVNRPEIDFDCLETIFKQEVTLSLHLLRYLNSAVFGWRRRVGSVKHAIMLLGEKPLRKWASLVALTGLGDDKPAELVSTCLLRARFCEQLASLAGTPKREIDFFFTGLLSVVDALVDRPLDEMLEELNVAPEIREALSGGNTTIGYALRLVTAYEQGDWEEVKSTARLLHVPEDRIPHVYAQSLSWAQKVLEVPGSPGTVGDVHSPGLEATPGSRHRSSRQRSLMLL